MYKKKSQLQLQTHPFMIINEEISAISDAVDAMVKELISSRSSFYIESTKIDFFDEEPYVTINCNYRERNWDSANQCLLDDYTECDVKVQFDYTYFDFEDLPLMIYSKIQELDLSL